MSTILKTIRRWRDGRVSRRRFARDRIPTAYDQAIVLPDIARSMRYAG